jgi:hypothetical protein
MTSRSKRVDEIMERVAESSAAAESSVVAEHEVALLPPDVYKARIFAQVQKEARANTAKTTVPGGCFKVNGTWVDAYGDPVAAPDEA